jgi:hypothetical protein
MHRIGCVGPAGHAIQAGRTAMQNVSYPRCKQTRTDRLCRQDASARWRCLATDPCRTRILYSLRSILLFANTDVSTTKIYLDISILVKSIMGRREYDFYILESVFGIWALVIFLFLDF